MKWLSLILIINAYFLKALEGCTCKVFNNFYSFITSTKTTNKKTHTKATSPNFQFTTQTTLPSIKFQKTISSFIKIHHIRPQNVIEVNL